MKLTKRELKRLVEEQVQLLIEESKANYTVSDLETEHIHSYYLSGFNGGIKIYFEDTELAPEDLTPEQIIDYLQENVYGGGEQDGVIRISRMTPSPEGYEAQGSDLMVLQGIDGQDMQKWQELEQKPPYAINGFFEYIINRHFA
jgi:hypothetical protein